MPCFLSSDAALEMRELLRSLEVSGLRLLLTLKLFDLLIVLGSSLGMLGIYLSTFSHWEVPYSFCKIGVKREEEEGRGRGKRKEKRGKGEI
jgi:hypothetical protein